MRHLLIVIFSLTLCTPALAQETPTDTPPTEVPEVVVVEATEAAPDTGVTINIDNTTDESAEPQPAFTDEENDALFAAVIIGLSVVVLGLLIVLGMVLRQYPSLMKTAQDSTPPWLDTLIRDGIQNAVLTPARVFVGHTESTLDDELLTQIDTRVQQRLDDILGPRSGVTGSHPSAVPAPPPTTEADAIAQARQERDRTHG